MTNCLNLKTFKQIYISALNQWWYIEMDDILCVEQPSSVQIYSQLLFGCIILGIRVSCTLIWLPMKFVQYLFFSLLCWQWADSIEYQYNHLFIHNHRTSVTKWLIDFLCYNLLCLILCLQLNRFLRMVFYISGCLWKDFISNKGCLRILTKCSTGCNYSIIN